MGHEADPKELVSCWPVHPVQSCFALADMIVPSARGGLPQHCLKRWKRRRREGFRKLEIVAADTKRPSEVAMWKKREVNKAPRSGRALFS